MAASFAGLMSILSSRTHIFKNILCFVTKERKRSLLNLLSSLDTIGHKQNLFLNNHKWCLCLNCTWCSPELHSWLTLLYNQQVFTSAFFKLNIKQTFKHRWRLLVYQLRTTIFKTAGQATFSTFSICPPVLSVIVKRRRHRCPANGKRKDLCCGIMIHRHETN